MPMSLTKSIFNNTLRHLAVNFLYQTTFHFSPLYSFASEDKRKKYKEKEKEYDLILDDEIEFIQALKMPGKFCKITDRHTNAKNMVNATNE